MSDGRHPVCIRVTSKGVIKRKSISSAFESEWDKNASRIKSRSRKDFESINDLIDNEYSKYKLIFNSLKQKDFYPEDVFNNNLQIESELFEATALLYLQKLRVKSQFTYISCKSRLLKVMRYRNGIDFRMDQINERFIDGFRNWCLTMEKNSNGDIGNSDNTINSAIKFIKMVCNYANVKVEIPKLSFKQPIKQKLTEVELGELIKVYSTPGTHEWNAKNTFLLQFYLRGMRIGDLIRLQKTDIVGDRLVYASSKTTTDYNMKIVAPALDIISLYKDVPGIYLLPFIRGQSLTAEKLHDEIKNRTALINRHLKIIAKKSGIHKTISTHIARHTFASIADKKLNGDVKKTQHLLGHGSRRMTEIYLADLRETDEMDDNADLIFTPEKDKNVDK